MKAVAFYDQSSRSSKIFRPVALRPATIPLFPTPFEGRQTSALVMYGRKSMPRSDIRPA